MRWGKKLIFVPSIFYLIKFHAQIGRDVAFLWWIVNTVSSKDVVPKKGAVNQGIFLFREEWLSGSESHKESQSTAISNATWCSLNLRTRPCKLAPGKVWVKNHCFVRKIDPKCFFQEPDIRYFFWVTPFIVL